MCKNPISRLLQPDYTFSPPLRVISCPFWWKWRSQPVFWSHLNPGLEDPPLFILQPTVIYSRFLLFSIFDADTGLNCWFWRWSPSFSPAANLIESNVLLSFQFRCWRADLRGDPPLFCCSQRKLPGSHIIFDFDVDAGLPMVSVSYISFFPSLGRLETNYF